MNNLNRKAIRHQLKSHGTAMKKSLGQNYLVSQRAIGKVLSPLVDTDEIVEIGPGAGNLTLHYFKKFKRVVLIELDEEKIPLLRQNLTEANGGIYPDWVLIIIGNFLDIDLSSYINTPYQILGALPYNISKKIIDRVFRIFPTPVNAIFILQKEVADKYITKPEDNSFLAISSSLFATAHTVTTIKRTDFYPIPKVDSKAIRFDHFVATDQSNLNTLYSISQFIKAMYASPRKKLSNTKNKVSFDGELSQYSALRPAQMTLEGWKRLYDSNSSRVSD